MGIILAVVVLRSGSLLPAMLLHFLNNGLILSAQPVYRETYPQAWPSRAFAPLEPMFERLEVWFSQPLYLTLGLLAAVGILLVGFSLLRPPVTRQKEGARETR